MSKKKEQFLDIKLSNNVSLMSDPYNFMIVFYGKNAKGERVVVETYYYSTIQNALMGYHRELVRKCGAKTINDLLTELQLISKHIFNLELK